MKKDITTIGSATLDIMYYTDDLVLLDNQKDLLRQKLIAFEWAAKLYGQRAYFTYGGGGANTAVAFANLGIKTKTILSLGSDPIAQEIFYNLKNNKVDTSLVQKHGKNRTGVSFIVNSADHDSEHVIFVYRGANNDLDLGPQFVRKINSGWVYLSSGFSKYLFDHCRHKKINIVWNPDAQTLKKGIKFLSRFLADTAVLIVNRDEAMALVAEKNISRLLKKLHKAGQKLTVITDGRRGAYVVDDQKIHYCRAMLKKTEANTTGAGDAFGSGFTAGLIKYNWDLDKALKLGIANSGSVVQKIGAQAGLLKQGDLKKFNL